MNVGNDDRPILLGIFALTYIGIAAGHVPRLKLNRVGIALLGAIAMMAFSGGSSSDAVSWVNWPAMFMLFGFFVLSAQLELSGFYGWIADRLSSGQRSPARFLFVVMAVTAGLSAVLNHDIVCYVFTPVVGTALLRRQINPVPFLIALALASNLGAAATLIGNAQGILIGQVAHLSFPRYLVWSFVPVAASLAAAYALVRRSLGSGVPAGTPPVAAEVVPPEHPLNRAHTIKGLVIFGIVLALFFTRLPKEVVVLVAAGIHLASPRFRTDDLLALVDWPILVLFMSLFVITGGFQATGYAEQVVRGMESIGFNPAHPVNETILTAAATALMNNAPAVMLLLKLVPLSHPVAGYILALANSFGGNMLLTASVSNIILVQQAGRLGVRITFRDFARLGVPVTLASLAILIGWTLLAG